MASSKKSIIEAPALARNLGGGDVSHGKKEMELTGDIDLDRARDHVLHDNAFGVAADGAGGKLGGGDVSAGKKEMVLTGDIDLDRARDHVLHGTMHGRGDRGFREAEVEDEHPKPAGGDVSGGKKEMQYTGAQDLDRAREYILSAKP
jgi:hypothetical protein